MWHFHPHHHTGELVRRRLFDASVMFFVVIDFCSRFWELCFEYWSRLKQLSILKLSRKERTPASLPTLHTEAASFLSGQHEGLSELGLPVSRIELSAMRDQTITKVIHVRFIILPTGACEDPRHGWWNAFQDNAYQHIMESQLRVNNGNAMANYQAERL